MRFNKIIKYTVLVVIILFIGKIIFNELFDARPFKFEKYKTEDQLERAAREKLPIGSDINRAISILEESGAYCHKRDSSFYSIYETITECIHVGGLFSLHPFEYYKMKLYGDKFNKLVAGRVKRLSGLQLIEL